MSDTPTTAPAETLPCPFCLTDHALGVEPVDEGGWLAVKCRKCGAVGPTGRGFTEASAAIARWNTRPTPAAPSGEREAGFNPLTSLPGEYEAGRLIRGSVTHDAATGRFYLTCSVGELAQRIAARLTRELEETREALLKIANANTRDAEWLKGVAAHALPGDRPAPSEEREALRSALADAADAIEELADQQAVNAEFYLPVLDRARTLTEKPHE